MKTICECNKCPLCRARAQTRANELRRRRLRPRRTWPSTCDCGQCKKCTRRIYMRKWRAKRVPRKGFVRDLDLLLPSGYVSTLDLSRSYSICLR